MKKAVKKIVYWAAKRFGGSGDMEKQDAIHLVDWLSATYGQQPNVSAGISKRVKERLEISGSA